MPKHIRGMEVNIPYQLCLICLVAEVVGFEPTREYSLLVFKTSAISQTRPHFLRVIKTAICVTRTTPLGGCCYSSSCFFIVSRLYIFSNDVKEDWEALEEKTAGRLAIGASCRI